MNRLNPLQRMVLWLGAMLTLLVSPGMALAQTTDPVNPLDHVVILQNWQIVLAFILPIIVALIVQSHWEARVQAVVAFVVAFFATALTQYFTGNLKDWNAGSLIPNFLFVFSLTIPFYYGFWKPTGATAQLKRKP